MTNLQGKAAIVTGASRGIGAAAARDLAKSGASVLLLARSTNEIDQVAQEITKAGGQALAMPCDVSRYEDLAAAVERCKSAFGRVDVLVNNAGVIDPIATIDAGDPTEWGQLIDINVKGVYHGIRAAAPAMTAQGSGVIVNISSGAATGPMEGWSAYCASKAAVLMVTRAADKELGPRGVRVVGLSPGTVATEMQRVIKASGVNPVSKLEWSDHIPPEWVGRTITWLCTDAAADVRGDDFKLREDAARRRVGLID